MRPSRRWLLIAVIWTALQLLILAQVTAWPTLHLARVVGGGLREGETLVCVSFETLRAMPSLNRTFPPPTR
mgnify:CR=1 FL=1